jgi:hypothetical protein
MGLRGYWHDVRSTPEGKMAVLMALALPFLGKGMIQSAFRFPQEASVDGAVGVVVISVLLAVVGVACGSVALGVQTLVLERRGEALRGIPAFKGLAAASHMALQTVGLASIFVIAWFTIMYAPTVFALHSNHLAALLIVFGTVTTLCVAAGITAYKHMLHWIEVRPASARALHITFAVCMVVVFAFMPIVPKALYKYWPERVEALGSVLYLTGPEMTIQLTLLGLLLIVLGWRTRAKIIESVNSPSPIIGDGVRSLGEYKFESSFAVLVRRERKAHLWRFFLAKDVLLPWSRRPASMFMEFLLTFSVVATGASLALLSHEQKLAQADMLSEMSLITSSLVALGGVSLYRGVGCVGVETPMLRILRSAVGARSLWIQKLLSAVTAMAPHLLVVAVSLVVGMMLWGDTSRLGYDLVILLGAAISLPLTGVGAGFLFPRLDSIRSGLVPGSTLIGRSVAAAMMLYFGGVSVALLWMTHSAVVPARTLPLAVIIATGALAGLALVMTMLGVRRLKGLEL